MSVHFRRMRIAGFKSFAEPVSVEIHAGLTGIVGPNGCGKSNVVEALRWAMGEQSTRSLRAGEMDDVIFAGTAGRPSRNLAEVTLTLDDTAGAVPPPFHEQSELEIIRRIERGSGSEYRVNGKEVARARRADAVRRPGDRGACLGHGEPGTRGRAGHRASRRIAAPCWRKRPASPGCTRGATRRS